MKGNNVFFKAGIFLLSLLLLPGILGCGAISNLMATPTPTSTPTPTPTPTSTSTPTPTPTSTSTPRPTPTFTITPTPHPLLDTFPQIGQGKLELFAGSSAIVKQDEPSCAYRGNYGIFFMASNVSWGINWKNTSVGYLDTSGFSNLTLWIRALQEPGTATIRISLRDLNGRDSQSGILRVGKHWTQISLPLSDFRGIDATRIQRLSFVLTAKGDAPAEFFCIDEVAFER